MYKTTWFDKLLKPALNPPASIFPPVWAFLYLTMVVSLFIFIAKKTNKGKQRGYIFFAIQIILNLFWSPTFFRLNNISLALLIVILLDVFVILTIKEFCSVSKLAGIILIPYLLWIFFATYLNIGFLLLN